MFENSNKGMVKEIAQETMKVHRLRNIMACVAIALTAILITIICGAGISTFKAVMTDNMMNPGPGTNGAGVRGSFETLEKIRQQPEVEWADIARPCMYGTPHNKQFSGNLVLFQGVNEEYYSHNYVELLTGAYPKNETEILMSDTMAKKVGIKMEPGQKFTLNLMVKKDSVMEETPIELTISGFYNNPLRAIENYEELYTTANFSDVYNPEIGDEQSKIYTKLKGVTYQTPTEELQEKLEVLNDKVGGSGIIYIMKADLTIQALGGIALLLLIIACGYFLIYNIFYISVVNDIRFMGSMKTIGMTGKQIRTMLGYQIRRLGIIGTVIGVIIGTGMNLLVVKVLRDMELTFSRYYEAGMSLVLAVLAAIVFSALTVWISSRKALSLAAKISPVEASRFRTSGRKKMVFAVISFALSGILFCVLYTVMMGFDVEYMVNRMNATDFQVLQYHSVQLMDSPYEPMDTQLTEEVKQLPFVTEGFTYYRARDLKEQSDVGIYNESETRLKLEGRFQEIIEADFALLGTTPGDYHRLDEHGDYMTGVLGMPAEALATEAKNVDILSGEMDREKFASGDYMIYQPSWDAATKSEQPYDVVKAGDKVPVSFYNYENQEYVTKEFTVLAVVSRKYDNYATQMDVTNQIAVPDSLFTQIYGQESQQMVSAVALNTYGTNKKEQMEELNSLIAKHFNTQVQLESKYTTRQSQEMQKAQKTGIGIFVGLVFGFIGIANVINTLVTGVLSRKIEYAAMQSIGMTKRQMIGSIFKDGMKIILLGLALIIPIGWGVSAVVSKPPLSTGFVPAVYAVSLGAVAAAGILLTVLLAVVLTETLNKKTVVVRLREVE